MTAAGPKRKLERGRVGAALLAASLAVPACPALAGLTERIVVDWHSGLAIGGYDPVAFFTDGKPMAGSGDFELRYAAAVWRFRNSGNRAAFADRPDVYMPRFGGYDPVSLARGVAVPGNPTLWLVAGDRLFLFHDAADRDRFAIDAARLLAIAERRWGDVLPTLNP